LALAFLMATTSSFVKFTLVMWIAIALKSFSQIMLSVC